MNDTVTKILGLYETAERLEARAMEYRAMGDQGVPLALSLEQTADNFRGNAVKLERENGHDPIS